MPARPTHRSSANCCKARSSADPSATHDAIPTQSARPARVRRKLTRAGRVDWIGPLNKTTSGRIITVLFLECCTPVPPGARDEVPVRRDFPTHHPFHESSHARYRWNRPDRVDSPVLRLAAQRQQPGFGPEVHDAAGDRRCGKARFTQRHPGKQFVLLAGRNRPASIDTVK